MTAPLHPGVGLSMGGTQLWRAVGTLFYAPPAAWREPWL